MKKILISAGEVSGDVHGAYLAKELKKIRPDIYLFGMGSERLAAEGVDIKFDISKRGTIGIFEALPNIFPIYLTFIKMKNLLLEVKPDLVLLIDSQGFNLPFAKFCKKSGVKTAYYIAPQEWLWGSPAGVKKVARAIDLIVAVFEKEYKSYKQAGANVVYFGHPLIDIVKPSLPRAEARSKYLGAGKFLVSLCPGSRRQEIKGLFPVLLEAGELIKKEMPEVKFIVPAASQNIANDLSRYPGTSAINIVVGQTYDVLSASDLAICTSGTINLEASLLGVPNIMVYKLSPLTYFIGKYILKINEKLPYFSMPNLLMEDKIIPELIMKNANANKIASVCLSILKDPSRQEKMKKSFARLKTLLGQPGAISNIAQSIVGFFFNPDRIRDDV